MDSIINPLLELAQVENTCDVRMVNALNLAFIGDTLYDLYVRTVLVAQSGCPVQELHKKAIGYVNAAAQASAVQLIMDELTEEELAVYKRGRNTKTATTPKHADIQDYRAATGLEAVLGYLYLSGNESRAFELMSLALERLGIRGTCDE